MKENSKLQQGDVILKRVDGIPTGAKKVKVENGRIVVALGEATGHSHVIDMVPGVEAFEKDGILYLKADAPTTIKHVNPDGSQAEHNPIEIGTGVWKRGIVREFDAFSEEVRRVQD